MLTPWGLLRVVPTGDAFVNGPPPATTGGFGEKNCRACHFDYELNEPGGLLTINGIPEAFEPGREYVFMVRLSHPRMERGGFELAVRFEGGARNGKQAGGLSVAGDRAVVITGPDGQIQYARQTRAGATPSSAGNAEWQLRWTAPQEAGPVVFHSSGNASNFDESPLGDYSYSTEIRSRPRQAGVDRAYP